MPLNIDLQQILLHMFNFVLLFAISYFLLYKPIKNFMESRKKYYEDMDNEAKENLSESEKARKLYEEKLKNADEEISKKSGEALAEAYKKRDEIVARAHEDAAGIIESAKKTGEFEKEKCVTEAKAEIKEFVSKAAEEIVNGNDPYETFAKAVKKDATNE